VNGALDGDPGVINSDPYGAGWFFKLSGVDAAELDGLMDATAYAKFVEEEGH
jgi:glycine cleavage system H protein